jgi:hypothetical protein
MPSENLDLHDYGGDRLWGIDSVESMPFVLKGLTIWAHICIPIYVQIYVWSSALKAMIYVGSLLPAHYGSQYN